MPQSHNPPSTATSLRHNQAGTDGRPRAGLAWGQARQVAHDAPGPLPPHRVPLAAAAGLTLAADLCASTPLPAFDTAAMDGYAVAGTGPYRIVGQVVAGSCWGGTLQAGEAVAISTGALVPAGAIAVLRLEQALRAGPELHGPLLAAGTHIRRAGEDAAPGAVLAPTGTPVRPALLGLAAACGHDSVLIRPRPTVTVLVTGDELVTSGPSGNGLVRDALGPMLPSLIHELGGHVTGLRRVPDYPADRLDAALAAAAADTSVVVVTGSTSVGSADLLRPLIDRMGATWIVDTVDCRPGHPQLLARLDADPGRWVVGLPGNPFAALVAAHTLLAPLLAGLAGRPLPALPAAAIGGAVPRPRPGQTRLLPVAWDGAAARVVAGHQPAFLCGAALADALAVIPPDWTSGQPVSLLLSR